MSQLYINRTLLAPKCLLLTATICLLLIVMVLIMQRERLALIHKSVASAPSSSATTTNDSQSQGMRKMGATDMEQYRKQKDDAGDWVDQQQRDLAELLALAKCNNNTLPSAAAEEDSADDAVGIKFFPLNDWNVMCRGISIERDFDSFMRPHCRDRFLLPDYSYCSGLGNQMYRFASLYGIGRASCRRPIFVKGVQECATGERKNERWRHHDRESPDEIEQMFPLYSTQLKYVNLTEIKPSDIRHINGFATKCCSYEDPSRLKLNAMKEKYVQFKKVDYLQHYKFFDGRRKDIRQIFQFSPKVCKSVLSAKCELFEADRTSHKLCVHNRLGDFIQSGWASDLDFTVNAINHINNELKPKNGGGLLSVILLGAEKDFLQRIQKNLDNNLYAKIYIPESSSRGGDLAFATIACDSLLITAPASTFSWWIGYLMPDSAPIYYSAHLEKTPRGRDTFLKEWIPLRLVNGTTIIREK